MLRGLAGKPAAPAVAARAATIASIDRHLEHFDALVCPVTAVTAFAHLPPPRNPLATRRIPAGPHRLPYQEAGLGFTTPFSLSGHPVVVLPVDLIDGLPVGLQIIGRRGGEADLLALAIGIEAIFDRHRPPLWRQWQNRFTLFQTARSPE
jgi:amidase